MSDVRYSLHVGGRALEAHAPHALDHHLVREADAEEEPVARRHLHGEGLLGQHHRVPRVHRHHPRAQADAGHLGAGHGQQRQRVGPEDLGRRRRGRARPPGSAAAGPRSSASGLSVSIMLPMRSGLAMSLVLLA